MSDDRRRASGEESRRRFLTAMAAGILGTGPFRAGRGMSAVKAWTGRAYFSVPEAPGLGITISEAAIRAKSVPLDKAERDSG